MRGLNIPDEGEDFTADPVELFLIRDAEASPLEFSLEPAVIQNDKGYYVIVHADMNGNQREDSGDYINRSLNDVTEGTGPISIRLTRMP